MKTKTLLMLYLSMRLLEEPLFWGPVILLALAKLGHMSTEQIFLSEALATGLILALDAPTGMLADMMGRKLSVIFGKTCLLLSSVLLAFMDSPIHGYIANALWAVGVSFRSGADSALIYDELAKRGELHEYQKLMKRVYSSSFFINAFTTLVAGFLAEVSIRLPLMLSLPGVVISCIIICFFPQEERVMVKHTMANYKKHLREALGEVKKNKRLQSLLIWLALLGVMSKLYFFTYNPYLEMVHVPYREVGAIFFAINIFGFIASRYATEIGEWLGGGGGFRVWFLLQGALMLIQGLFTQYLSGFLFALQGITRGYVYTVKEPLMNKEIGSEKRATVLSFQSSLSGLLQVMMFLVVSPLSGNVTMLLLVLGVASLALSFLSRKA